MPLAFERHFLFSLTLSAIGATVANQTAAAGLALLSEFPAPYLRIFKQSALQRRKSKVNFFALILQSRFKCHPALKSLVLQKISFAVFDKTGSRFDKTESRFKSDTVFVQPLDPRIVQRSRTVIIFAARNHLLYLAALQITTDAERNGAAIMPLCRKGRSSKSGIRSSAFF